VEPVAPGPGGFITTEQAAALCGVEPVTVRNWVLRGYTAPDGTRVKLPVAGRYKRRLLLNPVEVAKAEHATARRARRTIQPTAA
jgi:hypothetical protein